MWELLAAHPAILGFIGTLGIGGAIMAAIYLPIVMQGLNILLGNRLGCAILALAVGLFVGTLYGTRTELAKWDKANAQVEIERVNRDKDLAIEVAKQANETATALAEENNELAKKVEEYEAELAKRKQPACNLTPTDIKRLRNLQ